MRKRNIFCFRSFILLCGFIAFECTATEQGVIATPKLVVRESAEYTAVEKFIKQEYLRLRIVSPINSKLLWLKDNLYKATVGEHTQYLAFVLYDPGAYPAQQCNLVSVSSDLRYLERVEYGQESFGKCIDVTGVIFFDANQDGYMDVMAAYSVEYGKIGTNDMIPVVYLYNIKKNTFVYDKYSSENLQEDFTGSTLMQLRAYSKKHRSTLFPLK